MTRRQFITMLNVLAMVAAVLVEPMHKLMAIVPLPTAVAFVIFSLVFAAVFSIYIRWKGWHL